MWMTDESHVQRVILDFKERGMGSLDLSIGAGVPAGSTRRRPPQGGRGGRCRPDRQAVALSASSLADHLARSGAVEISAAHLGRVLADGRPSFQRTLRGAGTFL